MPDSSRKDLRSVLARNVRLLRVTRGWSQEVLAELSGLHRNYIGAVERAERNIGLSNLERIAAAFDVPAHELLKDDLSCLGYNPRIEEIAAAYVPSRQPPLLQ